MQANRAKTMRSGSVRRAVSVRLRTVIVFLSVLLCTGAAGVGTWLFLQKSPDSSKEIEIAERQRTRIQKITALSLRAASGDNDARREVLDTAARYSRALKTLQDGDEEEGIAPAPPNVQPHLRRIHARWGPFRTHLQMIVRAPRATDPFTAAVTYIRDAGQTLRAGTKRVAQEYGAVQQRKAGTFTRWGLVFLLLVGGVGLFLSLAFRPVNGAFTRTTESRPGTENGRSTPETSVREEAQKSGLWTKILRFIYALWTVKNGGSNALGNGPSHPTSASDARDAARPSPRRPHDGAGRLASESDLDRTVARPNSTESSSSAVDQQNGVPNRKTVDHEQAAPGHRLATHLPGVVFQWRVRPDGTQNIQYETYFVGDGAEELLGIDPEPDGFHERFVERVPPSHRDAVLESVTTAIKRDSQWRLEVPFDKPSGERIWLLAAATPERHERNAVVHGVLFDITEQKERERTLREREATARAVTQNVSEGLYRMTPQDGLIYANQAFADMLGYDEVDEALRADPADLYASPDERKRLRRAIREHDTFERVEVEFSRTDGSTLLGLVSGSVSRDETGAVRCFDAAVTDITEKSRYQEELDRMATRLELALEATETGIWEWDLATDDVFWDDACERLFGYDTGTFPGTYQAFVDRVCDEDVDMLEQKITRAVETGAPFQADFRIDRPDGEQSWLESRGLVQYDEDGDARRMIGIQTDITERKKRERELRRKERRYQAILEDPNILAGLLAPDGTLLQANQTAMEYVEADLEAVTGQPFWTTPWWDKADRPVIQEKVEQAAAGEYVEFEATHAAPGGEEHFVTGAIRPVTDRAGRVVSLVVSSRNITERKQRQREVKRRSDAMDAASDGIAILDSDGAYTYANQAHADIYGFESPEALLGNTWKRCYEEDEIRRFKEDILPTLFEQGRWRGQATGQRVDGATFPEDLTLTTLEDGGIICVVRDITQQKEKEQKLKTAKNQAEQAQEEAEEANRIKSAFLANMSHELRTPLTSIIGFAEAIGEETPTPENHDNDDAVDPEALNRFATLIEDSGQRLMETLNGVLNLSKLEAGEMTFSPERLDLCAEVQNLAEQHRPQAEKGDVNLDVEPTSTRIHHRIDPNGLQMVLDNLVSNAIKYTEAGGDVSVRVRDDTNEVVVEVEDTGIGMDPEDVSSLFEPFRQESEGLARTYDGTGLGLAIAKQAVHQMGGTIEVTTEKGEGSCFTVRFPRP